MTAISHGSPGAYRKDGPGLDVAGPTEAMGARSNPGHIFSPIPQAKGAKAIASARARYTRIKTADATYTVILQCADSRPTDHSDSRDYQRSFLDQAERLFIRPSGGS
jgi:hypothetical protein